MRILCVGWYGHGLVGDEAILSVLLRDIESIAPGASVCVTSANDAATARRGVRSIGYAISDLANEIKRSDLVILGGGGLFTEYGPHQPLRTLTGVPDFATLCAETPALCATMGVPCAIYSVGIDTLRSDAAKNGLRRAFTLATTACVRDSGSQVIAHEVLGRDVTLTCDPAALCGAANLERDTTLEQLGLDSSKPVITLSLRHWDSTPLRLSTDSQPWEHNVANALHSFCASHGLQILAVPHQRGENIYSNDEEFYRRFLSLIPGAKAALWTRSLEPEQVAAAQALGDVHLAMRHHGVILAAATLTPCGAIAYSNKVTAAMVDAGIGEYCTPLEGVSTEAVSQVLERLWANRVEIRETLMKRATVVSTRHIHARELLRSAFDTRAPSAREAALAETAARWREIATAADTPFAQSVLNMLMRLASTSPPADLMLPALNELTASAPNVGGFHYYLGFYQLLSGQADAAIVSFTRSIEFDFNPSWSHSMRADAREQSGDVEGAIADHNIALQFDEMLERSRQALNRLSGATQL